MRLATLAQTADGMPIVPASGEILVLVDDEKPLAVEHIVRQVVHYYDGPGASLTGIAVWVQNSESYKLMLEHDRQVADRIIRGRATRADLKAAGR